MNIIPIVNGHLKISDKTYTNNLSVIYIDIYISKDAIIDVLGLSLFYNSLKSLNQHTDFLRTSDKRYYNIYLENTNISSVYVNKDKLLDMHTHIEIISKVILIELLKNIMDNKLPFKSNTKLDEYFAFLKLCYIEKTDINKVLIYFDNEEFDKCFS